MEGNKRGRKPKETEPVPQQAEKVKPTITGRAIPKIVTVTQIAQSHKKWYLYDKQSGNKTVMSKDSANRMAVKYPNLYSAVYE